MPSYSQYKRQMAVMDADDANIETWITVKGNHIPIMKGQSKEEAVQSFLEKKGAGSSTHSSGSYIKVKGASQSGGVPDKVAERHIITVKEKPAFRELKGTKHQGGTIGLSKEEHNAIEKQNKEARRVYRDAKSGKAAREANARPILKADEKADVSDIVKQYKADMKALGENASAAKQNKVEVNAIKEFMRRKVGAGHPYEDYYNYWLRGMSKNDSDAFNSIYGESENREKAFEALSNEKDKPANKVSQSLKDDVDYYFRDTRENWNKIRNNVISKRGEGVFKDIRAVQNTGYYTPTEILNALEDGKKFDDMVSIAKPANKGWMSERVGRPQHIGEAVRNVVKKLGEQRAESKKTTASSSSGWPESPKFEKLTEKYMPKSGAADNELGEALRSINQAVYRYYNDGDMYNKGYGKETVNAAIKHLTQLSKNKGTPRHIARGIDNGLYELKTYGVKDKGRYETALKILLQTFEFADEKDIEALSKMKRNNG